MDKQSQSFDLYLDPLNPINPSSPYEPTNPVRRNPPPQRPF